MVLINLHLSKQIEEQARAAGLLTGEKIEALIEAELERQRQTAGTQLLSVMDQLANHMREKYGDLNEDEAQTLLDEWLTEADNETPSEP